MNKFIALDIGNVCINVNPQPAFKVLNIENDIEAQNKILKLSSLLETAKISEQECFNEFRKIVNYDYADDEIIKIWNSVLIEENELIVPVLKDFVKKGWKLIYFSDTSNVHINWIYENYSLNHLISGGIYSFDVGKIKPHYKMFETFEKKYAKPILYLDDKLENINGGMKYKWNSFLYDYNEHKKNANYADLFTK